MAYRTQLSCKESFLGARAPTAWSYMFFWKRTQKNPRNKTQKHLLNSKVLLQSAICFLFPSLLNTLPGNFSKGRNYNLPILLAIALILPKFLACLLGVLLTPRCPVSCSPLLIAVSSINSQVKGHLIPLTLVQLHYFHSFSYFYLGKSLIYFLENIFTLLLHSAENGVCRRTIKNQDDIWVTFWTGFQSLNGSLWENSNFLTPTPPQVNSSHHQHVLKRSRMLSSRNMALLSPPLLLKTFFFKKKGNNFNIKQKFSVSTVERNR